MTSEDFQKSLIDFAFQTIQKQEGILKELNHQIWSNPELAYEEHNAHQSICDLFEKLNLEGYHISRGVYGLKTAMRIEYRQGPGSGRRVVAFNAEYDALPEIGHACGHNLITTSSVAAFIATCETMRSLFPEKAELTGAYSDVDACLMVHPMPIASGDPNLLSVATGLAGGFLAIDEVRVTFTGKPAHAAAAPWEGINALDAVVAAYLNVSLLRQQMLPSQRVHGIIVSGGDRANIIPMSATMEYAMRSPTSESLNVLKKKLTDCLEAAATATGCGLELKWGVGYADLKPNPTICRSYVSALKAMGHHAVIDGNVSHAVPGFHAMFAIPSEGVNHTPQFTAGAGSAEAFKRSLACAAGMAVTACQILVDDTFAAQVRSDFDSGV
ncbi:peptidase M20 domain-containing protein 2 [Aspergillus awamori]|uniref:Peptidase M20 domain-containing protein 2 n=1 Tax=Aspergillus awamori TaxID=105351 RepID=A0A401KYU5_ASPAW|nr:peptidase M20 domain-containing protein 2 [Aspergillus awamori]